MAEKPDGRRTIRTWTERVALTAQWVSLLMMVQEIIDRWILPHV
ncbi:hypothetical protein ABZ921_30015 [Streptomyces atriruber]|uniref:Uncharacterized protein n=1 Tax=Streptomyces atriruber TaxID=545121 RepID=A0ABV3BWE8_9ACTN